MDLIELIKISYSNIKTNLLRSILTLIIIALGVMALVGILTSIDGVIYSMSSNFSFLGANSFNIEKLTPAGRGRRNGTDIKESPNLIYAQAYDFKTKFKDRATVALSLGASFRSTLKYQSKKTNPTYRIRGVDEDYFATSGYQIEYGRNFSPTEQESGSSLAIIGMDVVKILFDDKPESALQKWISIDDKKYQVVGVLKSKGATMNEGADKRALIPLQRARIDYSDTDFDISVSVGNQLNMDEIISAATGTMRIVRGLKSYEENDFEIWKSDGIIDFLKENTVKLRAAAIAIGLMTLLGAAIGLMNIMLVSVTERTKEIGIIKALGATKKTIMLQFLLEAVIICLVGGLLGVILAIPLGNVVTIYMGGSFIIPWAWISLGLFVCTLVGIISGFYPAMKAAALDPVESLRYE